MTYSTWPHPLIHDPCHRWGTDEPIAEWPIDFGPGTAGPIKIRRKLKGNNQRAKSFQKVSHFFALFHTFSDFFRTFPPGLSTSKQRVLAQLEQKRRKDNKKDRTNRCCTLVVARLSSSYKSPFTKKWDDCLWLLPGRSTAKIFLKNSSELLCVKLA